MLAGSSGFICYLSFISIDLDVFVVSSIVYFPLRVFFWIGILKWNIFGPNRNVEIALSCLLQLLEQRSKMDQVLYTTVNNISLLKLDEKMILFSNELLELEIYSTHTFNNDK